MSAETIQDMRKPRRLTSKQTCMALSGYTGRVPDMMKMPTAMATMTTARVRTPSCADLRYDHISILRSFWITFGSLLDQI